MITSWDVQVFPTQILFDNYTKEVVDVTFWAFILQNKERGANVKAKVSKTQCDGNHTKNVTCVNFLSHKVRQ